MLHIDSVELIDFMKSRHTKVECGDAGIIVITGENGEGKTTLIEAIALCLCDHKKADKLSEYINIHADKAEIHLRAKLYNKPLKVDVTIKGNGMDRTIEYEDTVYSNSKCSGFLEEKGLIYYSQVIFALQGSTDFVEMKEAERAAMLRKVLDVDFTEDVEAIDKKYGEVTAEIKDAKDQIALKEITMNNLVYPTEMPLNITEEEYNSKMKERENLNKDVTLNDAKMAHLEELKKDVDELLSHLKIDNESIQKLKAKNVEANDSISVYQLKKLDAESTIAGLEKDIEEQKKVDTTPESLEEVEKRIHDAEEDLNKKEDAIREQRDVVGALLKEKTAAETMHELAVKKLEAVSKGVCPECGRPYEKGDIAAAEESVDSEKVKLEEAENKYVSAQSLLETLTIESDGISSDIKNIQKERSAIVERNHEKERVTLNIKSLEDSKENWKEKIKLFVSSSDSYRNQIIDNEEAILRTTGYVAKTEHSIDVKQKEIADFVVEDISEIKEKIASIDAICNEYVRIINYNRGVEEQKNLITRQKTILAGEIEDLKKEIEKQEDRLKMFDFSKKFLGKDFPNYVTTLTCSGLNKDMSKIIDSVFDYLKVYLKQTARGIALSVVIDGQDDNPRSIGITSGFQQQLISLAFRVALAKAYRMSFSFFDEVDGAASEGNSIKAMSSILNMSLFEQIFIITQKKTTVEYIKENYGDAITLLVEDGSYSLI